MKEAQFPLKFIFNITTFSNDFSVEDSNGKTIAYVKQKLFKFIEEVAVFENEYNKNISHTIKADRWIDFNAVYTFFDNQGNDLGKLARKGWASIWKANYEIYQADKQLAYRIEEENPWVKVADTLLSEIPLLGIVSGYVFNPSYVVSDKQGKPFLKLKKEASFWGRKFTVSKLQSFDEADHEKIVLGLMMMLLLERRRG